MKIILHSGRIAMLLGLAAGTAALADPVSIPLDPTIPGASVVVAETYGPYDGRMTQEGAVLAIQPPTGRTNASAFGSLTNGAMGVIAFGAPDGSGSEASAIMYVNLQFTGTGTNTVNFDLTANWGVQGNPITDGVTFRASVQCLYADPVTKAVSSCASNSVSEYSEDYGPSFGPGNLSFPIDLSYQFKVDPQHENVQLAFQIFDFAVGAAYIDAGHTGLISIGLAPGVTMSQTNGFLTTPGDVTLPAEDYAGPPGGQSAVPEPSMLGALGIGLAALAGRRAWMRTRS
ncbi:MAG TPA: PEP-CTERM sorting domain-containing protein [Bryobacteraceae bacterium]|nr:PEP-CTERM sorting domain-containing protein [Bryobacteraceae bacterium]